MIKSIKKFFESKLVEDSADEQAEIVNKTDLASAALMIEVMNSDRELDQRESGKFLAVLKDCLNISDEDIADITALAEKEVKQATSLYEFTHLINDNYDYAKKVALIRNMWRIAFSDERLDKYEEHLIRRVSELIYVSHSDYIRTKLGVRDAGND